MRIEKLKQRIQKHPKVRGRMELFRHLNGESLTRQEAITGKCNDCACGFVDGKVSCELLTCTLFPFSPYRNRRPGVIPE